MSLFDTLIVQPIFNLLVAIYGLIPGGDFGISIIIFTIIIRLLMWPLVKKQLHQTKVMRSLQPELKKVKAKAKGNKQLEAQMMMELYREKGVSPFGQIGLLLVQLPIFIALFVSIRIITVERERIGDFTYGFMENLPVIGNIISDPNHQFDATLLGVVDLSKTGLSDQGVYWPLITLAAIAAMVQYYQSKQLTPKPEGNKRLRDVLKESASGKEVDQSEVSALMSSRMIIIFPFITFFISIYLPGALPLYFLTQSLVAIWQQHIILNRDVEEMEEIADQPTIKSNVGASGSTKVRTFTEGSEKRAGKSGKPVTKQGKAGKSTAKSRASKAQEATVVTPVAAKKSKSTQKSAKSRKTSTSTAKRASATKRKRR